MTTTLSVYGIHMYFRCFLSFKSRACRRLTSCIQMTLCHYRDRGPCIHTSRRYTPPCLQDDLLQGNVDRPARAALLYASEAGFTSTQMIRKQQNQ